MAKKRNFNFSIYFFYFFFKLSNFLFIKYKKKAKLSVWGGNILKSLKIEVVGIFTQPNLKKEKEEENYTFIIYIFKIIGGLWSAILLIQWRRLFF